MFNRFCRCRYGKIKNCNLKKSSSSQNYSRTMQMHPLRSAGPYSERFVKVEAAPHTGDSSSGLGHGDIPLWNKWENEAAHWRQRVAYRRIARTRKTTGPYKCVCSKDASNRRETLFASGYDAWDSLSEEDQLRLAPSTLSTTRQYAIRS